MRTSILTTTALALGVAACSGTTTGVNTPHSGQPLAPLFLKALEAEQTRSDLSGPYLDAIDQAARDPKNPEALAITIAALDALVYGATPEIEVGGEGAIAFRSPDAMKGIVTRLEGAWAAAGEAGKESDPIPASLSFQRGMIARALHRLALYTGEERSAPMWLERRGCAMQAAVYGPLEWSALRSLEGPSPIGATDPLPASVPGIAPFAAAVTPVVAEADACSLDVKGGSALQGSRAVVVDVENPRAQRVSVMLESSSAAIVMAGGVPVLRRSFDAGGGATIRMGSVALPEGWSRVVVRLARRGDGDRIELDLLGEDGERLAIRAPKPAETAPGKGTFAQPHEIEPSPGGEASVVVAASALLGLGEVRAAERLVEPTSKPAPAAAAAAPVASGAPVGSTVPFGAAVPLGAAPVGSAAPAAPVAAAPAARSAALELVYTRALLAAGDVPFTKAIVRLRASVERILTDMPASWEAKLLRARLAERRKGWGDGAIEALTDLGVLVAAPGDPARVPTADKTDRMILANIAMIARRSRLVDVSEAAYSELAKIAPGSALLINADARLHGRTGADAVAAACNSGVDRASLRCFEALSEKGDLARTFTELDRLRRLRGSPTAFRETEIYQRMRAGDRKGALAIYDSLPPAERGMLDVIGFAGTGAKPEPGAKDRVARDRLTARDTPWALIPLSRALGIQPDPAPALEKLGKEIVEADKASAFLPGAGTAVLKHTETYDLESTGVLHHVVYDLRRVSGTTDVAYGAHSYGAIIEGRAASRLLRRRIHKRDGRILEPDAAPFAGQGGSDLSQLEQGDYVEQITEGWALPNEMGQLTIDTPDLLPERTSVKEAKVTFRYPAKLGAAIWSHPLLGRPRETTSGDQIQRVHELTNAMPRRIEDGVPPLERSVAVSFGTQSWANIGRALEEQILSLRDTDPFVTRWIDEAAGPDKTPSRALVERVVAAAGKKIKLASGGELSDTAALYSDGAQRFTVRAALELGQGSRTWLIYRALRSLGVAADIAVAETEPYTTVATFPVHGGRFRHPLVVARLGGKDGDIWIDADVEGPPLPPGRISPELRGRTAMLPGGKLVTASGTATDTVDEIDIRLALDDKGDAKGSFTILLHGRPAQVLSEAFETVVGTERQQILRGVVLGWVPWADVEEVALSSSEGSWEVALRATIKISGFGRPEGKDAKVWVLAGLEPVHLLGGRNTISTLGATYASRAARQSALSIDTPMQYHVRRRIELPAGAAVTREPAVIAVDDPHLAASRKGTYTGNVIEEDYRLNLPTGTVDAAEYQAFVERVHVVDDGFMAGIRVKK